MSAWQSIKADTHRQFGSFSFSRLVIGALMNRTFRLVITLRLCQAFANSQGFHRILLFIFKVAHRVAMQKAGIDLDWRTEIGPGLAINHGWGLVVSPGARIGSNVTLFHGVTIGRRDRISPSGERITEYPVLEDEVWVGPHAIIIGGVTIGRGSRIAGGAFISQSIPPYSVAAGNPAMIVKSNCVPDVMRPAPIHPFC